MKVRLMRGPELKNLAAWTLNVNCRTQCRKHKKRHGSRRLYLIQTRVCSILGLTAISSREPGRPFYTVFGHMNFCPTISFSTYVALHPLLSRFHILAF